MRLHAGSATDVGRIRANNQDRILLRSGRVFAVADGMGGHRGGEVAAQLAVEALDTGFDERNRSSDALIEAVAHANTVVHDASLRDDGLLGMGTTITVLAIVDDHRGGELLAVANVGDSRTYWMRGSELEQLTEDHSVVAEMVRDGQLRPEDAERHPRRSLVTRALGVEPHVLVDLLEVVPAVGDRFLLCSDGLSGEVTDAAIAAVLRRVADPAEAARELVRVALARGGRDNISVVVVDVIDDDGRGDAASLVVAEEMGLESHALGEPDTDVTAVLPRSDLPSRAVAAPTTAPVVPPPRKARLVTGRSVLFVVLLAAVAATIGWAVTQGGSHSPTPLATPTTAAGMTSTTIDPFAPDAPIPPLPSTTASTIVAPGAPTAPDGTTSTGSTTAPPRTGSTAPALPTTATQANAPASTVATSAIAGPTSTGR